MDSVRNSTESPSSGLVVHERHERYLMTRVLQALLKPFKPALVKHSGQPHGPLRLRPPKKTRKRCDIHEREVQGVWVYDFTRESNGEKGKLTKRILYFCGGGWQMPPSSHHWAFCAELVCSLPNTTLTLVAYPLAPKNPVSMAFPQIERVYKALLDEAAEAGQRLVVAGDSSGGNIALAVTAWTLTSSRTPTMAPAAVFAMSPTTDLRHDNPDIAAAEKRDPIMTRAFVNATARTWSPGADRPGTGEITVTEPGGRSYHLDWGFQDPRVSPVQADWRELARRGVKVYGVSGSNDVLAPEAVAFVEKLRREGVEGEWLAWEGQMHCFPLTWRYRLRESVEAMGWIVDVLERV